jgi:single-strand DNA-binding protein
MSEIHCAFIGRVGQEPELKQSAAGKPWCRLSVVVGNDDDIQWVSCVAFGERATRICSSFHKDDKVYIEGAISLSEWTGRDGEKRTGLSVTTTRVEAPTIGRERSKRRRDDAASGSDVGGHRARHADAEAVLGREA